MGHGTGLQDLVIVESEGACPAFYVDFPWVQSRHSSWPLFMLLGDFLHDMEVDIDFLQPVLLHLPLIQSVFLDGL